MTISTVHGSPKYNVLITGGRAPVALELARLLCHAGHKVFVAESAGYHLCRVSAAVVQSFRVPPPRQKPEAYLEELELLINRLQIDLLVPMCEEIFYITPGLERLNRRCRVLCSGQELLHRLHHKGDFIRLAGGLGFAVPDTRLIESHTEWQNMLEDGIRLNDKKVFKPAYSRFASKVMMPRERGGEKREGSRPRNLLSEVSDSAPWVAQQYIYGNAVCTYSVVHEGSVVAHAAYGSKYRTGKVGASVHFEHMEHLEAFEWVRKFVGAVGFTGQIGFDFIEEAEGGTLYPIECNPRATSGIHLFTPQDGLEQAFLFPEQLVSTGKVITPQSGKQAMLTLPMLACGLLQIRSRKDWRAWRRALHLADDVVYRKDDPRPFYEQLRVVYTACRMARRSRISLTEALTEDIEWNGER